MVNLNPIFVILINGEPHTADQGRIRTYKTRDRAESEAKHLKQRYACYYSNKVIEVGEFVAWDIKEITI